MKIVGIFSKVVTTSKIFSRTKTNKVSSKSKDFFFHYRLNRIFSKVLLFSPKDEIRLRPKKSF